MEDREVDGGAFADLGRVHVAAEVAGPETRERLLAARRDGHPPEHRLEVDLHATPRWLSGISVAPIIRVGVESPEVAAGLRSDSLSIRTRESVARPPKSEYTCDAASPCWAAP